MCKGSVMNGRRTPNGPRSPSNAGDTPFEPTVEMMVNDFDDERTLEEEEALAAGESEDSAELTSLQREGDMPLEDLLALYGYRGDEPIAEEEGSGPDAEDENNISRPNSEIPDEEETIDDTEEPPEPVQSALQQLYNDTPREQVGSRLLRSVSRPHSEEEEEDYDYSPDEEEWKKTIMVGSDYQAITPDGLCSYDDVLPYENEDKLLWDPYVLDHGDVENYLQHAQVLQTHSTVNKAIPCGNHLRDDEQALYLLQQCGHNRDEALRRIRLNTVQAVDTMSLWSEEECRNFENGLRTYGKNFHLIQQNKVRTRSVGELVQFYYLWKKTERHDAFANKARLEKRKYTLHPGLTDYMDRFLEEQDGGRDRSSSPNVHSLLYGDSKRHRHDSVVIAVPPDPLALEEEVFSELPSTTSPTDVHQETSTDTTDHESPNSMQ